MGNGWSFSLPPVTRVVPIAWLSAQTHSGASCGTRSRDLSPHPTRTRCSKSQCPPRGWDTETTANVVSSAGVSSRPVPCCPRTASGSPRGRTTSTWGSRERVTASSGLTLLHACCTSSESNDLCAGQEPAGGRPRQDSNLRFRLRRAALYPLSYGGQRPGLGGPVEIIHHDQAGWRVDEVSSL